MMRRSKKISYDDMMMCRKLDEFIGEGLEE